MNIKFPRKCLAGVFLSASVFILVSGCNNVSSAREIPVETPMAIATQTKFELDTPTSVPTNTSIPTATQVPTLTLSPTLTLTPTPTLPLTPVPDLLLADFDVCNMHTKLGGQIGTAPNEKGNDINAEAIEDRQGCSVKLNYDMKFWSAFWLKLGDGKELQSVDLRPYQTLSFDVKLDPQSTVGVIKLELHRDCATENNITRCRKYAIKDVYITGDPTEWQTINVSLKRFEPSPYFWGFIYPMDFAAVEELVFVFEANRVGISDTLYLDNIGFWK